MRTIITLFDREDENRGLAQNITRTLYEGCRLMTKYYANCIERFAGHFHIHTESGSVVTDGRMKRVRHFLGSAILNSYTVQPNDEVLIINQVNTGGVFTITLPALPTGIGAAYEETYGGIYKGPVVNTAAGLRAWGRRLEIIDIDNSRPGANDIHIRNSAGAYIMTLSTVGGKLVLQAYYDFGAAAWQWAEIGCCGGEPYGQEEGALGDMFAV